MSTLKLKRPMAAWRVGLPVVWWTRERRALGYAWAQWRKAMDALDG